ncbi:DUF4651 domain-containing protein [Streptococcus cameli]
MNKKKTALLAGLLGAGVLAASAKFYHDSLVATQKSRALKEVRQFFAAYGEIATVFVDESQSTATRLIGGVVMEAGPVYLFKYENGEIQYEEEKQ